MKLKAKRLITAAVIGMFLGRMPLRKYFVKAGAA
jgi:hypothetical protein